MMNAIRKIRTSLRSRRRRQELERFRREAASCGYRLDDLTDAELESAIAARGKGSWEKLPPLTGRSLYWLLRRIAPDEDRLRRRKIKPERRS